MLLANLDFIYRINLSAPCIIYEDYLIFFYSEASQGILLENFYSYKVQSVFKLSFNPWI